MIYVYSNGGRIRKVCFDTATNKKKHERIYLGGYELYREYDVSENLELERATHKTMDDKRMIALLEVKTVENGAAIANGSQVTIARYQYTNHLDSACLDLNESAEVISYEECHPFGTTSYSMHTNDSEVSLKRYQYVHKELDTESGLYYYGARYYAAWLCRFVSVDPLKDKYPFYTTYQYAGNKPINAIDLDGMEAKNVVDEEETGQQGFPANAEEGELYVRATEGGSALYQFNNGEWEGMGMTIDLPEVEVVSEEEKGFWEKAGDFAYENVLKNIPVVGGLVNAVESAIAGDWKGALIGLGEAVVDAALLITTGGLGNIAKIGLKTGAKLVLKETLENYAAGEVSEELGDAGIPGWAQVALGVGLGIKAKRQTQKGTISETKDALIKAKKEIGLEPHETLPKGKQGKMGGTQRGDDIRGYRLDPPHPDRPAGDPENFPHINYWDYSKGKRKSGKGVSGAMPIKTRKRK